ncbi:tetratricopeptide repeat protein [Serratia sp. JSRIV006]|uniref:tetratricopeptide repeat protein n=1 Tax=Serratia sp. JSRIV006 TaxID=2831896 RepID=UPI001CBF7EFB|nr:tetratricopeptide repeat protein [Serratia sp. JSRIV006]UAN62450.1 sel1 repeat family protein [Serratia sp. JSRIV006]
MFLTVRQFFILGIIFLWWSTSALASYEEGRKAYGNGNYAEALKQFQPLAQQGDAYAQHSLGTMYSNGYGVEKDDVQAIEWYRKAAEQGFSYAQFNLGVMYDYGAGIAEDLAQAVVWYRKAADQGLADAQYSLGVMYATGRGIAKDHVQAMAWFHKAANQKFDKAQYALGYKYANGDGVEKDEATAVFWLRKAANQGYISAKKALEEIKAKEDMSITPSLPKPTEVKAAIQRAVDFIDIETFDAKLLIISKLRSADVLKVPGCIYESKRKVNCIIQLDFGMDNVMYMQLPLEYRYSHWEAPILEKVGQENITNPSVPSPTVEQAQQALEQFAKNKTDETSELITSGLIKLVSIKQDCKLNEDYGMVNCSTQVSKRDKNNQQEEILDLDLDFHLKDSEWQYGPSENTER